MFGKVCHVVHDDVRLVVYGITVKWFMIIYVRWCMIVYVLVLSAQSTTEDYIRANVM